MKILATRRLLIAGPGSTKYEDNTKRMATLKVNVRNAKTPEGKAKWESAISKLEVQLKKDKIVHDKEVERRKWAKDESDKRQRATDKAHKDDERVRKFQNERKGTK